MRAGAVILLADGYRYLCDSACADRFRQGERAHDRSPKSRLVEVTPPEPTVQPTRITLVDAGRDSVVSISTVPEKEEEAPISALRDPRLALVASAVAALCGALSANIWMAALSCTANLIAIGVSIIAFFDARRHTDVLSWLLAPVGACIATVAALAHVLDDEKAWFGMVGAAVASAALLARAWIDARSREPVSRIVEALLRKMPKVVSVPVASSTDRLGGAQKEVSTDLIRTGEEVLALEGETVAVDGVVKAGEAMALLHPGARVPVRRVIGDPLLAGARIVEGNVRILATRVGEDRALVRPNRFRHGGDRESAPVVTVAQAISRWGGLLVIVAAGGALFLAEGHAFSLQLSAAAAVLLAAPLLAIRRAADSPLVAAAATAGERGIVFHNARSLERAGRVTVAALATRGTITEGKPEVVEIHAIDDTPVTPLIALAAAAESAAEGHAIARAILRFAEARGVSPESVRRAQFLPGRGVTALAPGGEPLVIGNRQLLLDEGVSVAVADAEATRAEAMGRTAIFIGLGGRVRAVLAIEDDLRPGARSAVQRMMDLHIEVVLISGDHRGTVEALAKNLDIDHVRAELLPDEQGTEVRRLGETGGALAAIGRPIHDDAALAAAYVPVVLGAAGGPAGERAVALATEDIRDAAAALWIARAARQGAWRGALVAAIGGLLTVATATMSWAPPAVAAVIALLLDAYALPTGARLLHRIALRLPARS